MQLVSLLAISAFTASLVAAVPDETQPPSPSEAAFKLPNLLSNEDQERQSSARSSMDSLVASVSSAIAQQSRLSDTTPSSATSRSLSFATTSIFLHTPFASASGYPTTNPTDIPKSQAYAIVVWAEEAIFILEHLKQGPLHSNSGADYTSLTKSIKARENLSELNQAIAHLSKIKNWLHGTRSSPTLGIWRPPYPKRELESQSANIVYIQIEKVLTSLEAAILAEENGESGHVDGFMIDQTITMLRALISIEMDSEYPIEAKRALATSRFPSYKEWDVYEDIYGQPDNDQDNYSVDYEDEYEEEYEDGWKDIYEFFEEDYIDAAQDDDQTSSCGNSQDNKRVDNHDTTKRSKCKRQLHSHRVREDKDDDEDDGYYECDPDDDEDDCEDLGDYEVTNKPKEPTTTTAAPSTTYKVHLPGWWPTWLAKKSNMEQPEFLPNTGPVTRIGECKNDCSPIKRSEQHPGPLGSTGSGWRAWKRSVQWPGPIPGMPGPIYDFPEPSSTVRLSGDLRWASAYASSVLSSYYKSVGFTPSGWGTTTTSKPASSTNHSVSLRSVEIITINGTLTVITVTRTGTATVAMGKHTATATATRTATATAIITSTQINPAMINSRSPLNEYDKENGAKSVIESGSCFLGSTIAVVGILGVMAML